jgi:hypothetical protein
MKTAEELLKELIDACYDEGPVYNLVNECSETHVCKLCRSPHHNPYCPLPVIEVEARRLSIK